jgi:hypothetical protein
MGNAVSVPVIEAVITDFIKNNNVFNELSTKISKTHILVNNSKQRESLLESYASV